MLKRLAFLYRAPGVLLAALFLLAGAYFGSSHDFGLFLLSIPVLGLLFLGVLITTVWTTLFSRERRSDAVAWVLICLTPLAYYCAYGITQRIRFLLWAPAHYHQLARASAKDEIVLGWDSWGMAGEDTFSYLVVDTRDRLGSKARSDQWTRQIGQSCGVSRTQRMWPRLYIVTTYTNCPYDGVEPAA
jgi:hypothetical protein